MLLATTASGCAAPKGRFPSLEPRPFELGNTPASNPAATAPAPAPATEAIDRAAYERRITTALDDANRSRTAFAAAYREADRTTEAARGSARTDERWILGQQAMSRLEMTRGGASGAQASLDLIALDLMNSPPSPLLEMLGTARATVDAIVEDQRKTMEMLAARLR